MAKKEKAITLNVNAGKSSRKIICRLDEALVGRFIREKGKPFFHINYNLQLYSYTMTTTISVRISRYGYSAFRPSCARVSSVRTDLRPPICFVNPIPIVRISHLNLLSLALFIIPLELSKFMFFRFTFSPFLSKRYPLTATLYSLLVFRIRATRVHSSSIEIGKYT